MSGHRVALRRSAGFALVWALMVCSVLAATSVMALEASLLVSRSVRQAAAGVHYFHAADAVLSLCEREMTQRLMSPLPASQPSAVLPASADAATLTVTDRAAVPAAIPAEPVGWRRPEAFNGGQGVGLPGAGQRLSFSLRGTDHHCLAEPWINRPPAMQVWLLTVRMPAPRSQAIARTRGFAEEGHAGIWLQSVLTVSVQGAASAPAVSRQWRTVAEPPF